MNGFHVGDDGGDDDVKERGREGGKGKMRSIRRGAGGEKKRKGRKRSRGRRRRLFMITMIKLMKVILSHQHFLNMNIAPKVLPQTQVLLLQSNLLMTMVGPMMENQTAFSLLLCLTDLI